MKGQYKKYKLAVLFVIVTSIYVGRIQSQTLNIPGGTGGIGSSGNGNVGINTASPVAKLDVNGDVFVSSDNSVITIKDDNIGLVKKAGDSGVWGVGSNYNHRFGKWSTPSLTGNISSGTFIEQMRIDNNGNMGIGTMNPIGKLEISGGNLIVNRPLNKVDRNGINEFSAFEINNSFTTGQSGYVKVFYPSYNNLLFGADYDGHIGGVQPNIQFGQKNTPFLTVVNNGSNTGNVGIGTINPGTKLEVNGDILESSDNSVITIKDDNIGLVKKASDSGVWAVGSNYNHRFGKWSTPSLTGNISSGTFIEQMRINNNGNVGIGVTNPSKKLEVATNTSLGEFRLRPADGLYQDYRLDIVAAAADIGAVRMSIKDNVFLKTYGYYDLTGLSLGVAGYEDLFHLKDSGNVGIGTTTPDQRLTVKGKIHAEEVIVDLNVPVADYVFKPNYKLMPLPEVEQFVKTNSHLPEIPSAGEITKNGLSMGEMQNKLLQKVEELTLYMISQQKTIDQQQAQIKELNNKLSKLNKQ